MKFSLRVDAAQVSVDDDSEYGVVYAYRDGDNHCEVYEEDDLALRGDIDDNYGSWFENYVS